MEADEKACPFCAETIKAASIVCKHCGRDMKGKLRRTISMPNDPLAPKPEPRPWGAYVLVGAVVVAILSWHDLNTRQAAREVRSKAQAAEDLRIVQKIEAQRIAQQVAQKAARPQVAAQSDGSFQREANKYGLRELEDVAGRWRDAVRLAMASPRISMTGPIEQLQSLRREAVGIAVPDCMAQGKRDLIGAMDYAIEALLSFMQGSAQTVSEAHFGRANAKLGQYVAAHKTCVS